MNGKTIQEIMQELQAGVHDFFQSEAYRAYLRVASKFHTYSVNNVMLILRQKPDATCIAGYRAWQEKFHRHVKKGEKAIKIIAPIVQKKNEDDEGSEEQIIKAFKIISVFDVSQTEGESLPEFPIYKLSGDFDNFIIFRDAIVKIAGCPVKFKKIGGAENGHYNLIEQEIVISNELSQEQTIKTMIHELVHARLHSLMRTTECDVVQDELEAESIAYVVCSHFNLDTSDYSFGYLVNWGSKQTSARLTKSLTTIQQTASTIIDEIENQFLLQRQAIKL